MTLEQVGCGPSIPLQLYSLYTHQSSPENETELSFFSRKDYDEFKLNPEVIRHRIQNHVSISSILQLHRLAGMYEFEVLDDKCINQCNSRNLEKMPEEKQHARRNEKKGISQKQCYLLVRTLYARFLLILVHGVVL
jgi:hypothetical protein